MLMNSETDVCINIAIGWHLSSQPPTWERRADRLKLKRSQDDVDRLSPRHWRGELRAATCDLLACWKTGVAQAETVLKKVGFDGVKGCLRQCLQFGDLRYEGRCCARHVRLSPSFIK